MKATSKFQRFICLGMLTGLTTAAFGQQPLWDKGQTFTEAPDPVPVNAQSWQGIKPGLHSAFGSIDKRYLKSESPAPCSSVPLRLQAGKGARLRPTGPLDRRLHPRR